MGLTGQQIDPLLPVDLKLSSEAERAAFRTALGLDAPVGASLIVPGLSGSSAGVAVIANQIYAYRVWPGRKMPISRFAINIVTASAGGNVTVGISDASGALKVQGTISTATTGVRAIVLSSAVNMIDGDCIVFGCDNATATFIFLSSINVTAMAAIANENNVTFGKFSATLGAGGVMPSALGTLTALNFNAPVIKAQV